MSDLKSANLKYFNNVNIKEVQLFIDICKTFYWYTPPVDRTNLIISPIRVDSVKDSILPESDDKVLSFEDCVEDRIKEIITLQNSNNKKIVLCYSGGIDSTTVLCNFIKYTNLKDISERIIIAMSPESVLENPMTYNFIKQNFNIIHALDTQKYLTDEYIVIVADPGTGNFCHDGYVRNKKLLLETHISRYEFETSEQTVLNKKSIKFLCEETAKKYNIELKNYGDYHWWWHFNFRFNPIISRWHLRINNGSKQFWENQFFTFYSKTTFQNWSLNEGRYIRSSTLKQIQKDTMRGIISEDFIKNKRKYFSASKLFKGISSYKAIDSNYRPISNFIPEQYYNPNNNINLLL